MSAPKTKDTLLLPTAARLFAEKDEKTAQRVAVRLCNPLVFRYYDRPSVCSVGLSTAEVIAKPLSDWNEFFEFHHVSSEFADSFTGFFVGHSVIVQHPAELLFIQFRASRS